jgi:hypothetical protein
MTDRLTNVKTDFLHGLGKKPIIAAVVVDRGDKGYGLKVGYDSHDFSSFLEALDFEVDEDIEDGLLVQATIWHSPTWWSVRKWADVNGSTGYAYWKTYKVPELP